MGVYTSIETDRLIDLLILSIGHLEQDGPVDTREFVALMLPALPEKDQTRIVRLIEAELRRLENDG